MSFFQSLVEFFQKPESEEGPPHPHLLRVIMLLETAHLDDHFAAEERNVIQRLLSEKYGLQDREIASLQQLAQEKRNASHDIFLFTRQINEMMSKSEKIELLSEIWQVIYADGSVDKYEDHMAGKLKTLLRLDREDWVLARRRAQNRQSSS